MIQTNLFPKQKLRHREREQVIGHKGRKEAGGMNWETGVYVHTLLRLHIK